MFGKAIFLLAFSLFLGSGCSQLGKDGLVKKSFVIKKSWIRNTLDEVSLGHRQAHRMPPVVLKDFVIQGNGNNGITAFEKNSGQRRWKFLVEGGVEGGAQAADGNLYFGGNDGKFYAVSLMDGRLQWEFKVNSPILARPLVKGSGIYFLAGNNTVYALDKKGEQKWLYRRSASGLSVRGGGRPVIYGDTLYIGMSDGFFVAIDIKDGKLIWERQLAKNVRFTDIDSTPVLHEDKVFISSYEGSLFCLSRKDGQIVWRVDQGGHAPVTIVKDRLYYSTSEGRVLALNKENGNIVWSYKVPRGIATQPRYFRGLIVFGESEGPLRFLSGQTGRTSAHFATGRGISAAPGVVQETGEIFAISNEGLLYALKTGWFKGQHDWPWLKK